MILYKICTKKILYTNERIDIITYKESNKNKQICQYGGKGYVIYRYN